MMINADFERWWAEYLGKVKSRIVRHILSEGEVKEACREAYSKGYYRCCDENHILYGKDADRFYELFYHKPSKKAVEKQKRFLDECRKVFESAKAGKNG